MSLKDFTLNTTEAQVVSAVKKIMNIAGAAQSLGIPKTTLSSILSKLERKLDNQIFIRKQGSGAVIITEFGHEVLPKLEKLLWIAESMEPKDTPDDDRYNAGALSIMSTQTILESFVCPYLLDFVNENPNISLNLQQKDAGYFFQPQPNEMFIGCWEDNTENYSYIPFHSFKQKLWASKKYLDQFGPINSLEDLHKHRLILIRGGSSGKENFKANDFVVRRLGLPLSKVNAIMVVGGRICDVMAEKGLGIMAASMETCELNNLDVVSILPELEGEEVPLFLKIDKRFIEHPLAQYAADWIFACRDKALRSIGIEPQMVYVPFNPQLETSKNKVPLSKYK